nr:SDR family oxidoreductase [Nitrosopumilus sp.]
MNVFVTGERGFVGSNLTKYFLKTGITVVNIQDESDKNIKSRINLLDREKLWQIENVDAIIHLASKTSIPDSIDNPYDTYYTNIIGTLNILDFARQRKIKKIINISTYIYGKPIYLPIDENHPINPHSPYNKSKILAENLCENFSKDFGIDIVTLRPFYIYGPSSNPLSFIPSIIQQIEKNERVLLSHKNTKRDFLFVDDFLNLISKILNNFPIGYSIYNVGSGRSNSLEEIIW